MISPLYNQLFTMKRILSSLLTLLFVSVAAAQTKNASIELIAAQFQNNYNEGTYESLFNLFNTDMQKSLPLPKAIVFFNGLKQGAGLIKTMKFAKLQGSTYSRYITQFEKALMTVDLAVDQDKKIAGFIVNPYKPDTTLKPEQNSTLLAFPLKGSWKITWGGDTKEQNYHVESESQKNAFDIIKTDVSGKSYRNSGKLNTDYFAFGQEISAPCDGEVVLAINGVKDNTPGEMNSFDVGGNTVILKTTKNEYLVFCHLKHGSMLVKEGQQIKKGQLLGQVGNSGHSSEAHLHFHLQNKENMNTATGIKCFFDQLMVNGIMKSDYSPVRNDQVGK